MKAIDLLAYALMAIGTVMFVTGVIMRWMPEPLRRYQRRLLAGGLVVAFALPAINIAFNWTETVQLVKAESARIRAESGVQATTARRP